MKTKTYIAYKSDKECYRIRADDYQVHEGQHKLFLLDHIVGSFPVKDKWVIMPDEFISDETEVVELIKSWEEYRKVLIPEQYMEFTEEELIKIWWNEQK